MEGSPAIRTESRTSTPPESTEAHEVVLAELLIEEISIDGMCGVY
jgi:mycofactocin precursor